MSTVGVELTTINCGCGGTYAINERFREIKQERGGYWHCPYCGNHVSYSETDLDKLKKQLAREKHNAEQEQARLRQSLDRANERANYNERRRAAAQGQLTKVKKRVSNGVCPCCNRTFQDLQRHMANKHPDYTAEPAVK